MPSNQINPFNYDIDSFDSGFLGPISDTNFRNWLFSHNLPVVNPVIGGVISNAWGDRGTEYDVSQSNPNVPDVPNLTDVANTPSVYNNLTNPRQVNLSSNIPGVNPQVAAAGITNQDLGVDAATLLNQNSSNIDLPSAEDVSDTPSAYNNFTYPRQDSLDKNPTFVELATWYPNLIPTINQYGNAKGTNYGVPQTLKLGYAGNVESWVSDGGYITTTSEIRDAVYFRQNNVWGPSEIIQYNTSNSIINQDGAIVVSNNEVLVGNTGFKGYNTNVQGDFRDQLFSRSLGVGVIPFSQFSSGINYKPDGQNPSELDVIARKRRGVELANRLKLNFVDDTVGAINVNPFGLLGGGNLLQRNYSITVPKSGVGKAAEFIANLAGLNVPISIIPDGAFDTILSTDPAKDVDITNDILDYTGSGQKSLLFDALYTNKYGPNLQTPASQQTTGEVKKDLAGAGQPPVVTNYLTSTGTKTKKVPKSRSNSLIGDINEKVKAALGTNNKLPQKPTEDFSGTDPIQVNSGYGFDTLESPKRDTWASEDYVDSDGIGVEMPASDLPESHQPIDNLMYWGEKPNRFKKGILKYTQDLVNKSINNPQAAGKFIGVVNTDANYNEEGRHIRYSNGNTTLTEEDGSYCRSWSVRRPYNTYSDLIRSEKNWWRIDEKYQKYMTLTENGTPKIAWDSGDNEASMAAATKLAGAVNGLDLGGEVTRHVVPYMFSIENLAWKDSPQYAYLPLCEKGPNGGRIMWFPPYNIDFSDNTSVSWDTTSFIGRGEPIYTYNHTERSGSLSFSIVVDHPSVLNELRNNFKEKFVGQFDLIDGKFNSFFGGCSDVKDLFKNYLPETAPEPKKEDDKGIVQPQPVTPKDPLSPPTDSLKIYFPNARTDNKCGGTKPNYKCTTPNLTQEGRRIPFSDGYETGPLSCGGETRKGLNEGVEAELDKMAEFLVSPDGKNYTIKVYGYCSGTAKTSYNEKLGKDRAQAAQKYLYDLMVPKESQNGGPAKYNDSPDSKTYPAETTLFNNKNRWVIVSKGESGAPADTQDEDWKFEAPGDPCTANGKNENSYNSKISRFVEIKLEKTSIFSADIEKQINDEQNEAFEKARKEQEELKAVAESIAKNYIGECDYFLKLKKDSPFVYDSFVEKLDNFHPAFHAITPEGFNSRITFLQQCTRQGPQMMDYRAPQNMVFGKPPVCVLKIGDFYHTKIIMDSVNFSFDPLQWDLNPEGIGVQPMIVKVDISFKFIGGSSLGGPIKQLQNAVSYNFFANTGIYQPFQLVENYLAKREGFVTTAKVVYGAFLTPEDADNTYKSLSDELKNKTTVTNPTTENTTTNAEKDKINEEANKTLTDETQSTQGSNNPPTPPVNEDEDIMDVVGIQSGTPGVLSKIKFSVKEDKKDKWNLFALDYDYKDPCGSGTAQRGSVSSDNKSAVFDILSEIMSCNDKGDYSYKFTIWFQATEKTPDPKTGTPYYRQIVKSHKVVNTVK